MQTGLIQDKRQRQLNQVATVTGDSVVYIMSRDQRVRDNYALLNAQAYAEEHNMILIVLFNLYAGLSNRAYQHFAFMVEGLKEVEEQLHAYNIPLKLAVCAKPQDAQASIESAVAEFNAGAVFFDFSPLREATNLRINVAHKVNVPVFVVDTTNIVPLWIASDKEEYSARTIRSKIHKHLGTFLVEPPELQSQNDDCMTQFENRKLSWNNDWNSALQKVRAEKLTDYSPQCTPGEKAAHQTLDAFLHERLESYAESRNDPSQESLSNLSPYLHFGQIASLRAALEALKFKNGSGKQAVAKSTEAFIEELVVRRELAQNFCYYNKDYRSLDAARNWARKTLEQHRKDPREHTYSLHELEQAQTHDPAWNASQIEMMRTGKMHGYMRMYWAKKILEWSETPEIALKHAITLNDRYELDGYEPNGYVGILWAVAGVHDRAWTERPIFGKIRYMNYNGLKRKFDIEKYIRKWLSE
ncbi:MAG: deoxyribodipyrimidine photo-lyase [Patescibacteria group bacterium]